MDVAEQVAAACAGKVDVWAVCGVLLACGALVLIAHCWDNYRPATRAVGVVLWSLTLLTSLARVAGLTPYDPLSWIITGLCAMLIIIGLWPRRDRASGARVAR